MFLQQAMNDADVAKFLKFAKESTTYTAYYKYWLDQLFERVMRLFVWENTGDLKPKEIEQRLLLTGHCGIAKYDGELTAFYGTPYGPTKYQDEFTHYTVHCPIYSGTLELNKNCIMIDNNALRNPLFPLVHHYATLLAHSEVTIVNTLVNARDAGGVPVATTEKQKQSLKQYLTKLYDGKFDMVTDIGNLGLTYVGSDRKTAQDLGTQFDVRGRILKSFYSDIGIRSAFEKRSNAIAEEVEADNSLLLMNVSDMLHSREQGAEAVNAAYGTNWTVHVAEEIDYGTENELTEVTDNDDYKANGGDNESGGDSTSE